VTQQIIWKGNEHTNHSSRGGIVPCCIVNHISAGTLGSMDNWFTSPNNTVSSAHFGIGKQGQIHQYVAIEHMAWANGLSMDNLRAATAPIVFDKKVNPNLYTVSIEHEGHDGDLTEEQFEASVWLHKYIRDYIRQKWNKDFPLDEYHVIGHFQINKIAKPNCPGPKFPWNRLYEALKETEEDEDMLREELEQLRAELNATKQQLAELQRLSNLPEVPDWAEEAVQAAIKAEIIDSDVPVSGSYDFYRIITILHRKGLI